jgi:glutamine amidotransferase
MDSPRVAVIDYGMGNVWSVMSALKYLGAVADLVGDPGALNAYEFLVLPGVGSFRRGMQALQERALDAAIYDAVTANKTKILGICLGMQLLGAHGTEDGETDGLGLVSQRVDRFTLEEVGENKIPHVGFNPVHFSDQTGLFSGLQQNADFYFTHSYRMAVQGAAGRIATCRYGTDFLAAFEVNNVCGTQFHPEKSQTNGLTLLRNFLEK